MDFNLKGLLRGSTDTPRSVAVQGQGNVLTAKLLPDYATLVAENRVFHVIEASATASVTTLPTTAALPVLANGEPADGLWYVVLAVFAFNSANAVALDSFGLATLIQMQVNATTFAQDIARTSVKPMLSGGGAYSGNAVIDTGVSAVDDLWIPIGRSSGSTAINSATGASLFEWLHGMIVLKPGGGTSLVSTATSGSNTTRKGWIWAEVPKSYLVGA